jgi:hypothetical protein
MGWHIFQRLLVTLGELTQSIGSDMLQWLREVLTAVFQPRSENARTSPEKAD